MTISTQTSTVTFIGNGATSTFSFPFVGVATSDLQVIFTSSSGAQVVLDPSQYILVINAPAFGQLWGIGGTVTYPTSGSPIQIGTFLTVIRTVPYTQNVSIANQGAFYPQAVEQGLDLLELQIQQIESNSVYALRVPFTDPQPPNVLPSAAQRANGYLGFDNNGEPVVFTTAPSVSPLTFAAPRRINTTGTATLSVLPSDSFGGVSVYQTSTPVTTLQLPSGYGPFPVFDGLQNFSTFPVKVLPPFGLTIQGQPFFFMSSSGQSESFYNDGTQIFVL